MVITTLWLWFEVISAHQAKKKSQGWLYFIQRSDPFFLGAMTGIEWESLHCQQSKRLLGGFVLALPLTSPQSPLPGQPGLHYVVSSAPSVLVFSLFSTVSPLSMIRCLCHRSSWCLDTAGAGADPRVQCCRSDPFPHTLGIAGARDRDFWMQHRGLDPISSPDYCFPIPGAKLVHPWD